MSAAVIEPLLSLADVARVLGVSRAQVYVLIRAHGLPARKLSERVTRVHPADLSTWLESRKEAS
jgi:excisionase family DNA binding protein